MERDRAEALALSVQKPIKTQQKVIGTRISGA